MLLLWPSCGTGSSGVSLKFHSFAGTEQDAQPAELVICQHELALHQCPVPLSSSACN